MVPPLQNDFIQIIQVLLPDHPGNACDPVRHRFLHLLHRYPVYRTRKGKLCFCFGRSVQYNLVMQFFLCHFTHLLSGQKFGVFFQSIQLPSHTPVLAKIHSAIYSVVSQCSFIPLAHMVKYSGECRTFPSCTTSWSVLFLCLLNLLAMIIHLLIQPPLPE